MHKVRAIIHSRAKAEQKDKTDIVEILHESGPNDVIVEYNGKKYSAIYNPFVGYYYVDDIYGEIKE